MKIKFDYDDWVKQYLTAYDNSEKAKRKTKEPWTIEINKRFFEQEGYYLPTGALITDVEREKLDLVVQSIRQDNTWVEKYK